jgi:hypothetical protein
MPSVEESNSPPNGSVYKFHCDAKDGKSASDYVETHKPNGSATGDITTSKPSQDK